MFRSVRKTTLLAIAVAFAISSPPITAQRGQSQSSSARNGVYIVQMIDPPSVANTGTPAFAATKPARGQKIDPDSAPVVSYAQYLDRRHDEALAAVGGTRKLYDYRHTLNGFAAELTSRQAEALKNVAGVIAVDLDHLVTVDTATTPQFLGLMANDGLWNLVGGVGRAGEDIVIGDVDSGIWPESESFSDRTADHGKKDGKSEGKKSYHPRIGGVQRNAGPARSDDRPRRSVDEEAGRGGPRRLFFRLDLAEEMRTNANAADLETPGSKCYVRAYIV